MSRVALEGVSKRFGDFVAVDNLTLEIQDQEFLVLLGPSGCGKSTALRMIAGLEKPTEGTIQIGFRTVNEVEPKDRDIAMVFQSYALYPHMTVARNIEFPLKSRDVPKEERAAAVHDAAEMLSLEELLDRKPAELSGGQRQRVALARAIVRRPEVFLMDEPLSNLDAKLRVQTRAELIELQRRLNATVIYVTHDQVEAMTMGHRIAILDHGVLQQCAPPSEVYDKPANLFVARFIGNPPMNTVEGDLVATDDRADLKMGELTIAIPAPLVSAAKRSGAARMVVGVRPEHLRVGVEGLIPATVTVVESLGHERHIICRLDDGQMIIVRQPSDAVVPSEGAALHLTADPEQLHLFDAATGATDRYMTQVVDPAESAFGVVVDKAQEPRRSRRKLKEAGLAYLLLLPALVIFAVFVFYPFLKNFQLATQQVPPFPGLPSKNVGLDQIRDVLGSKDFLDSLWTTILFALITVPIGLALGLGLAMVAHQKLKGIAIFRTIFSSTVATSIAVAAVIFGTLMNPQVGLLPWIGINPHPSFLENPSLALPSVAVATIWQNLGLSFILMSAGLQSVPDDLLEAAEVDGAGAWSKFRNVTLPLLSPTVFFAVVVGTIFAFQTFGQIDLLTQGGPLKKTNVLTYYIYSTLRESRDPGKAAVLAIALFTITMVLTLFQLRFLERRVHYAR